MSFNFEPLEIPEVVLVRPTRHYDGRGFFMETYRRSAFLEAGIAPDFVQDNVARSNRNVLRGLHYQLPPATQGKLVSVVRGSVFDVAVDLRVGAPTYGRWVGRELDDDDGAMLWVPPGFAHGYVTLTDETQVAYKVTAEYAPELERGVRWDDPAVGIAWPVSDQILSDRDRALPLLADADNPFVAS